MDTSFHYDIPPLHSEGDIRIIATASTASAPHSFFISNPSRMFTKHMHCVRLFCRALSRRIEGLHVG